MRQAQDLPPKYEDLGHTNYAYSGDDMDGPPPPKYNDVVTETSETCDHQQRRYWYELQWDYTKLSKIGLLVFQRLPLHLPGPF